MTIKVKVPKIDDYQSYDVLIGKGLINKVGDIIKNSGVYDDNTKGFLIIIGKNSSRLYLDNIKNSLREAGYNNVRHIIVGQEKINKTYDCVPIIVGGNRFQHIIEKMKKYIYIPTTLLGMANNTAMGHPMLTISDINLLNTLDYKYLMSGYSEIAKHAIIKDFEFFEWLEAHGRSIFDGDENARLYAIKNSCQIKASLMSDDKSQELLNFGHLYADAINKLAKTRLLHGETISIGMVASFNLAKKLNMCEKEDYVRVRRHLKSMSLPVELYADYWQAEDLIAEIDAKSKPVIIPKRIGEMQVFKEDLYHKTLLKTAYEIINK